MDAISDMEYDYVASGHYAKVVHPPADQNDASSVLELSQDMVLTPLKHSWRRLFLISMFNVCIVPIVVGYNVPRYIAFNFSTSTIYSLYFSIV